MRLAGKLDDWVGGILRGGGGGKFGMVEQIASNPQNNFGVIGSALLNDGNYFGAVGEATGIKNPIYEELNLPSFNPNDAIDHSVPEMLPPGGILRPGMENIRDHYILTDPRSGVAGLF